MARTQKVDPDAVLNRISRIGPSASITRGEAAAVLAWLMHDPSYLLRKLIGNQIDRAVSPRGPKRRIPTLARQSDGRLLCDDLAHWAAEQYKRPFSELPQLPRAHRVICSISDSAVASDSFEFEAYPATLERCHAEMKQMYKEIRSLKRELAGKELEFKQRRLASLQPKK